MANKTAPKTTVAKLIRKLGFVIGGLTKKVSPETLSMLGVVDILVFFSLFLNKLFHHIS